MGEPSSQEGFLLGRAGDSSSRGGKLDSEEDRSVNLFVASEVAPPGPSSGESSLPLLFVVIPEYALNRVHCN